MSWRVKAGCEGFIEPLMEDKEVLKKEEVYATINQRLRWDEELIDRYLKSRKNARGRNACFQGFGIDIRLCSR